MDLLDAVGALCILESLSTKDSSDFLGYVAERHVVQAVEELF